MSFLSESQWPKNIGGKYHDNHKAIKGYVRAGKPSNVLYTP